MKKEKKFHTVRGYQLLNKDSKQLTSSMEDYLEMIYRICQKENFVRTNQLANKLNVRPSSVSKIIQKLKMQGLVKCEKYSVIQLTNEGKKIGTCLLNRHEIIESFLKNIGISKSLLKDTEMIEHDVGLNTLQSIHTLNMFFYNNPDVLERFNKFMSDYKDKADSVYPKTSI